MLVASTSNPKLATRYPILTSDFWLLVAGCRMPDARQQLSAIRYKSQLLIADTSPLTASIFIFRHSHGNGNPVKTISYQPNALWIPIFMGMTTGELQLAATSLKP